MQNLYASKHEKNTVYAVFNNHRNGDFKPYLLKSTDNGKTWQAIQNNLPEKGSVQCLAEDHTVADLLFVGTEFGAFCSINKGMNWEKLGNNLPTIMVKEIAIQERENDLVLGTFGRGFWVLDDYSPLKELSVNKSKLEKDPIYIFSIKDGKVFIPSTPLGHKGKSFQGESFYVAPNPSIGANISYFIKDDYKTLKEIRTEREQKSENDFYPSKDSIKIEQSEEAPYIVATITDNNMQVIRKIKLSAKKGFYRLNWDGRMNTNSPVSFYTPNPDNPYESEEKGPIAIPGEYAIEFNLFYQNKWTKLGETKKFNLKTLFETEISKNESFNKELKETRRVVLGVNQYCHEINNKLNYIKALQLNDNKKTNELLLQAISLNNEIMTDLGGDQVLSSQEFETLPGIVSSMEGIVWNLWSTTQMTTTTYVDKLKEVTSKFNTVYSKAEKLITLMNELEKELENLKFPYTPGRFPVWNK